MLEASTISEDGGMLGEGGSTQFQELELSSETGIMGPP
jgi:hypothetical protein